MPIIAHKPNSRPTFNQHNQFALDPIVRLWILRILVPMGGHGEFITNNGFRDGRLAASLGMNELMNYSEGFSPRRALQNLKELHRDAEKGGAGEAALPPLLMTNLEYLSQLIGLTPVDWKILAFVIKLHTEPLLDDAADRLGSLESTKLHQALSVIIGLPYQEIRQALGKNGNLTRTGLVTIDRVRCSLLKNKLDLLSRNFADYMVTETVDLPLLLRDTVRISPAAELSLQDYPYLTQDLKVLLPYLKQALASQQRGVNIYLYGAPGTGNNQLTRALAQELGVELYEVACEDCDGDPVDGNHRLRAYKAAHVFFAKQPTLLVFDEVEDVFKDRDPFDGPSTAQSRKGWMNRALEENVIPTLWLSNSIRELDPAYIRRFDMVIHLPIPPRQHRERILGKACDQLVDSQTLKRLAEHPKLAPAVATKAASVVSLIQKELGQAESMVAMERLISKTLQAQGHEPIRRHNPERLPESYDPRFIHTDVDVLKIATGLAEAGAGRLCLYGPPGTGKTAYARWLAESLELPLVVKRGSDLLSPWVGGSEKNIAHAFQQAEDEKAILLIDEVDSFLQDRQGAQRSWEITQVNEMLTQMESFPGIFIASTNLVNHLDRAALRRFDLKARFDFLKADQARELLARHCQLLGLESPEAKTWAPPFNLTPGDFGAVMRQHRFRPLADGVALCRALEDECELKSPPHIPMGFQA